MRKIPVPANRYTPLKENWMKIFTPVVEHLHLQIRFNLRTRNVEIKVTFLHLHCCLLYEQYLQTCKETKEISALQKAADFVRAFVLGFDIEVRIY
jgi:RNA-binding protein PNO1